MSEEYYTVKQLALLAGTTVRTLHHYDRIDLLKPEAKSSVGYRLYSRANVETLQLILFYRDLEFSLETIKQLLDDAPNRMEILLHQRKLMQEKSNKINTSLARLEKTIAHEEQGVAMKTQELFPGTETAIKMKLNDKQASFEGEAIFNFAHDGSQTVLSFSAYFPQETAQKSGFTNHEINSAFRKGLEKLAKADDTKDRIIKILEDLSLNPDDFTIEINEVENVVQKFLDLRNANDELKALKVFSSDGTTKSYLYDEKLKENQEQVEKDFNYEILEACELFLEEHEITRVGRQMLAQKYLPWCEAGDQVFFKKYIGEEPLNVSPTTLNAELLREYSQRFPRTSARCKTGWLTFDLEDDNIYYRVKEEKDSGYYMDQSLVPELQQKLEKLAPYTKLRQDSQDGIYDFILTAFEGLAESQKQEILKQYFIYQRNPQKNKHIDSRIHERLSLEVKNSGLPYAFASGKIQDGFLNTTITEKRWVTETSDTDALLLVLLTRAQPKEQKMIQELGINTDTIFEAAYGAGWKEQVEMERTHRKGGPQQVGVSGTYVSKTDERGIIVSGNSSIINKRLGRPAMARPAYSSVRVSEPANIRQDKATAQVPKEAVLRQKMSMPIRIRQSENYLAAFDDAYALADEFGSRYIEWEHLLYGALKNLSKECKISSLISLNAHDVKEYLEKR